MKIKLLADMHGPCSVLHVLCEAVVVCMCVVEHVRKKNRVGKKKGVCKQSLRFKNILKLTAQLAAMFSCCWVENSCHDRAWSVCMWEGVCAWHTHEREREERRRAIGGWAIVQTASVGLVGGKAAFVRSQPPQQLPPTWRTLCEKIHPAAHTKLIKTNLCS